MTNSFDNRKKITNALRLIRPRRNPTSYLHIRKRFKQIIQEAQEVPDRSVYVSLQNIRKKITPLQRRELLAFEFLMGEIRYCPTKGIASDDIIRFLRECYFACDRSYYRTSMEETLFEKQWDGSKVIRKFAYKILESKPVTDPDLDYLMDSRAFSDLKISIISRVFTHRQGEFFERILSYFLAVWNSEEVLDSEVKEFISGPICRLSDFGPDAMPILYEKYLEHFENRTLRGYLMRSLINYEPALPSFIAAQSSPQESYENIRLIRQLIVRGNLDAIHLLSKWILGPAPAFLKSLCLQFFESVKELILNNINDEQVIHAQDLVEKFSTELKDSNDPNHKTLSEELDKLDWLGEIAENVWERLVLGQATEYEKKQLRRSSLRRVDYLLEYTSDFDKPERARGIAVDYLNQIYSVSSHPTIIPDLLKLFHLEEREKLKADIINTTCKIYSKQKIKHSFSVKEREKLESTLNNVASLDLKEALHYAWPILFRAPSPAKI